VNRTRISKSAFLLSLGPHPKRDTQKSSMTNKMRLALTPAAMTAAALAATAVSAVL
jgi:hypothetical protein